LAARAVAIVETFGLEDVGTMGPVFAASALSLARQHRREEAFRAARRAKPMALKVSRVVAWQAHLSRALLARAYVLLGDPETAQLLIREVRATSGGETSSLQKDLDDVERLVLAMPVTSQSGPASITAAELRVLHLLHTHLSFSEIGDLLFRSRNTVKTQAISIYRKLDVGSRGEAVQQAIKLGLH
jgi:LuxR family maltose regulon positive regulatory protein